MGKVKVGGRCGKTERDLQYVVRKTGDMILTAGVAWQTFGARTWGPVQLLATPIGNYDLPTLAKFAIHGR